jgi:glycosyl transferase family 2
VRLLALLAVRDEMAYLPGYLANVRPQVDGIVALDDGSRDGSGDYLRSSEAVLEVLEAPSGQKGWDEQANHRALVGAALRHGAEWLLALDADERLEQEFRPRAERVIRRGRLLAFGAYSVRLRELWNSPDEFRVDGIWGRKAPPRLFRARTDHVFDPRPLHGVKAPLQDRLRGDYPLADLEVYHLRMIRREQRLARRRRYERLDPAARWQPEGYAYLTDETGLRLRRVRARRRYVH